VEELTGTLRALELGGAMVYPLLALGGLATLVAVDRAIAFGLLIALFALFAFNFLARTQSHALDRMERIGSRVIDHIFGWGERWLTGGLSNPRNRLLKLLVMQKAKITEFER
jgi:hypothetical protein